METTARALTWSRCDCVNARDAAGWPAELGFGFPAFQTTKKITKRTKKKKGSRGRRRRRKR
jgi:hypothetical protein